VIERKPVIIGTSKTECNAPALQAMGDRLLDWFSVIKADADSRKNQKPLKGITMLNHHNKNIFTNYSTTHKYNLDMYYYILLHYYNIAPNNLH
jgi:hypothetical protein